MDDVGKLQNLINDAKSIVFFGGAGVSCESGIPDFRSADGLYNQKYAYPPETMLSRSFFDSHTKEFYDFYRDKMIYREAQPNAAHLKLAEIENTKDITIVTQNIDGLHQKAGSEKVLELHGSVLRNYCMKCGKFHDVDFVADSCGIPRCECGGIVKPDVVLYEESLDGEVLEKSVSAISKADLMIIGGTSLVVYPAAGLVNYFSGRNIVVINRDKSNLSSRNYFEINRPIGEVMSEISVP